MMATTDKSSEARVFPAQGPHSRFAGNNGGRMLAAAAREDAAAEAIPAGPISLLLVDSQPEDVERHCRMLREQVAVDAQSHVARTAAQALTRLAERPIDVVLCEYVLPDADGLGLLASIAALHPRVATILVTAHGSETVAANHAATRGPRLFGETGPARRGAGPKHSPSGPNGSARAAAVPASRAAPAVARRPGAFRASVVARHAGHVSTAGSFVSTAERNSRAQCERTGVVGTN